MERHSDGAARRTFLIPDYTPLILHAFLPTPDKLRVEFLGRESPGKVEHTYAVIRTHDFYRRVWTKPFLTVFGSEDAVAYKAGAHGKFQRVVPGAAGQPHRVIEGANHFFEGKTDELGTSVGRYLDMRIEKDAKEREQEKALEKEREKRREIERARDAAEASSAVADDGGDE